MGSEDWAFKRFWLCFFPEPAGTVIILLSAVVSSSKIVSYHYYDIFPLFVGCAKCNK